MLTLCSCLKQYKAASCLKNITDRVYLAAALHTNGCPIKYKPCQPLPIIHAAHRMSFIAKFARLNLPTKSRDFWCHSQAHMLSLQMAYAEARQRVDAVLHCPADTPQKRRSPRQPSLLSHEIFACLAGQD